MAAQTDRRRCNVPRPTIDTGALDKWRKMDYSLKRINKLGTVDEVVSINVGSDGLALAWGRLFSLGDEVEVWRGSRQLMTIVANGAYRGGKPSEIGPV